MGRMADARKRRAQRVDGGGGPAAAAEPPAVSPRTPDAGTSAEELVFDDEPVAGRPPAVSGAGAGPQAVAAAGEAAWREPATDEARPASPSPARIELPASGLAEDILARHEAALAEGEAGEMPPMPEPHPVADAAPVAGHSLSFFAAPVQEQRAAVEATEHLVTFYLDREEYGVDVRQVQEIRRVGEITTVPRAPEFVRGVINLRGRILPVLDMKKKLGLGEVAASRTARIVVVRVRERLLGLLVDGASQVPKIPVSRIEPPPEEVVERGGDYIRGVAKLDDRLIILVDLERLLAHELRAGAARPAAGPESA